MAKNFKGADTVNINGKNYNRTLCEFTLSLSGVPIDITDYVKGIEYEQEAQVEFDYSLGSNRPKQVGFGKIESSGTLTLFDAGVIKLTELALSKAGVGNILYLGQAGQMNIVCEYTLYDGTSKTDLLEWVFFTTNPNGVNSDDVIYSREISMLIGGISHS